MTKYYRDAEGNYRGAFDGNHGVDVAGWTEVSVPPPPLSARYTWDGSAWVLPEEDRVADIEATADALVDKYVSTYAWTKLNSTFRKRNHLSQIHIRNMVAIIYDELTTTYADLAALKTALDAFSTERDQIKSANNTMTHLSGQLHTNMLPIEDWIAAVYAHAAALIDDDQLTPDWGKFEAGAGGADEWKSAWTNTLDRFS